MPACEMAHYCAFLLYVKGVVVYGLPPRFSDLGIEKKYPPSKKVVL